MSSNEVFQTQLCTIMDIFVESAVREVSRLLDECFVAVMENEENSLLKREMTRVNKTNTRKFASFMEVLSKTSIEKIALLTYVVESEVRAVEKTAENRPLRRAGGRTDEKPQRVTALSPTLLWILLTTTTLDSTQDLFTLFYS
ncbi:uncharacterized protein isoform X2 [Salmo salar]|uniref:Uncharacterized protein isoform X2 n=1 Tax=Salmo salar TaxID=8030 RepID=A0A1S3Q4Y4_SALSA|nr:uncharacterized protein LOC106589500 isoform X2 [Salmo salar]|eukprot:XP_014035035.1 PREDICTED: uncharacterized protein LOC106589500 isoform X2 [Salmo salar]